MPVVLQRLWWGLFRRIPFLSLLQLARHKGFLYGSGWFHSVRKCMPLDRKGQPLPWYTYASIEFLEERIKPEWSIFEYGTGNSTLWWASRLSDGRVICCEHERGWYEKMNHCVPDNVDLYHKPLGRDGVYSNFVGCYSREFDIVVIDGRERIACAKNVVPALKDEGVVIWDNSDHLGYQPGFDLLTESGFKRLDFHGMGPMNCVGWSTSIFYRPRNCLDI